MQKYIDMDSISRLAQACYQSNPTIVLGSGASIGLGLPSMAQLQEYLTSSIIATPKEEDEWLLVKTALNQGDHLEAALEGKTLQKSLIDKIVIATWKYINEKDHELFLNAISKDSYFPLGEFLKALFQSSNNIINVVTTNYDRAIELSCNAVGLMYSTGFTPGYYQQREATNTVTFMRGPKIARMVRIWKVHGSLDWFSRKDGTIIGLPVFELPYSDVFPQIVTPGLNKFEKTHQEPFRSSIAGADQSLENAQGYLCVGFGFRDPQIEPKLIERFRVKDVPIVVLARTLTDEAKVFLKEKAGSNYLGIEKSEAGSKLYTSGYPNGFEKENVDLWNLENFKSLVV